MTTSCLFCRADALECSEDVRHFVYFLIGRNAPPEHEADICESHVNRQVMGLAMIATLTGNGQYAAAIRDVLNAPKLRLVPPTTPDQGEPLTSDRVEAASSATTDPTP